MVGGLFLNHLDNRVEGFPLTRLKSWYLIALFPLVISDLVLQVAFFTRLDPAVITSCCGVVFEVAGEGFGSSLASLPPKITMPALLLLIGALLFLTFTPGLRRTRNRYLAFAFCSLAGLVLGLLGIVSFVAPYVYMMPALHCPFIFLDEDYFNYGYLVYLSLFPASFFGMSTGILIALEWRYPSLKVVSTDRKARYLQWSGIFWLTFLAAAYGPIVKFWIMAGGKADLFQVGY